MRHRDYSNPLPFRDELLQVFIPRMYITIIVLKDDRTTNQPPCCLLQLQDKVSFHLPRSGCLGPPVTLPQSLYGRTDGRTLTSEPKFFGSTGYQIFLPMVLRELRYNLTILHGMMVSTPIFTRSTKSCSLFSQP